MTPIRNPRVAELAEELGRSLPYTLHGDLGLRVREAMRLAYETGRVDGGMELADKMLRAGKEEAA